VKPRRILIPLAAGLGLVLAACNRTEQPKGPPAPPPAVPVSVATAQQRDLPIQLRSVGTVESISAVTLRPQVAGQLVEVPVSEGAQVNTGDVLARIDPRSFQASVREAEATLAKDQATAADLRRAAEQLRAAYNNRAVAIREVESAEAKAAAADAQVLEDQAAVETARLNLSYCTITAPFAGRLGAFVAKPGSILKANETDLVDLTQLAPIDVGFSIREQDLPAVRRAMGAGEVRVEVTIAGDKNPVEGALNFLDNRVDATTGAIRLKARFDNADNRLWPGQYVNAVITLGMDRGVVVVPSTAVQASQRGQAVFVVNGDTAEMRTVTVRRAVDGTTVVDSGIAAGETVVTDGQLRLTSGAKVAARQAPTATPAGPPTAGDAKPKTTAEAEARK
jgi:multidrug efflux system membrane fusion protein